MGNSNSESNPRVNRDKTRLNDCCGMHSPRDNREEAHPTLNNNKMSATGADSI